MRGFNLFSSKLISLDNRQLVAAVVEFVVGMSFDPMERDCVGVQQFIQLLPQVDVLQFSVLAFPVFRLPTLKPTLVNRNYDKLRIGVKIDLAGLF